MRIVSNHRLIRRNAKIGRYASIVALIVLGAGMYITFAYQQYFFYSLVALVVGFILSQVGIYFGNRWGRSPRPDEFINSGLKGLGREYTIYHYATPASHLLVGPTGLWVLLPFHQAGKVTYERKRWRLRGGGFVQSYLRLFGQDNIGRPDLQGKTEIESVKRYLNRELPDTQIPEIKAAAIFYHPQVELDVQEAPIPTLTPKDFKELLRKQESKRSIPDTLLTAIRESLPKSTKEDQ